MAHLAAPQPLSASAWAGRLYPAHHTKYPCKEERKERLRRSQPKRLGIRLRGTAYLLTSCATYATTLPPGEPFLTSLGRLAQGTACPGQDRLALITKGLGSDRFRWVSMAGVLCQVNQQNTVASSWGGLVSELQC